MAGIKRLIKDTAIYGVSSIVGRFLNWCLVPMYTYMFPTEQYGIVTNIYAYVALVLIILLYGMETGFFRFANHERWKNPMQVYSTTLISVGSSSLMFVALACLFSSDIAGALNCGEHPSYIWMMAVAVGIDAFSSLPFSYLRYKKRPVRFAMLKFANIGLNIGLNLFFLVLCPWIWKQAPDLISWFYDPGFGIGYIGRDINWADDSYNYEKYYPFTTVKTAVFNGTKASDSGFSNLLTTAYVGTDCKELSFSSKNLSNLFVFTNDITRAYLGSTMANVYVIDKFNIPTKISELTCQSINNLIEIQNLLNGATYTYGNTPTIDSNNFINNVVDMSLNISASSLDTSVGFYDFGISLTLSNNLWDVNFNVPYSYSVTPAPLTVIANDASRKYGTENPEFTCSFFGFKNNETQDVLTKQPTIETTATITSNVGSYPIIPYGAEARNYTFTYERGQLNITKANQEIVWSQVFDDIHVGDIIELTAESSSGLDIKYTSTDETIAEIFTQSGKKYVEFLKTGNVSIRANQAGNENYNEADRVSKSIEVKAKSILVSSLTFDCTEWNGYEDSNFQITATILPENATNKALQWSSSDEDVATVDNDGFVTILAPGDCIISAKTLDGSNLSADCSIKAVSGINMIEFDENAMFDVYNSNGIMIKKSASNETLNSLSPGLYIIIQNGIAHKIMIK